MIELMDWLFNFFKCCIQCKTVETLQRTRFCAIATKSVRKTLPVLSVFNIITSWKQKQKWFETSQFNYRWHIRHEMQRKCALENSIFSFCIHSCKWHFNSENITYRIHFKHFDCFHYYKCTKLPLVCMYKLWM